MTNDSMEALRAQAEFLQDFMNKNPEQASQVITAFIQISTSIERLGVAQAEAQKEIVMKQADCNMQLAIAQYHDNTTFNIAQSNNSNSYLHSQMQFGHQNYLATLNSPLFESYIHSNPYQPMIGNSSL